MSIFFFNDTATTEIYTLSLHDALPISGATPQGPDGGRPLRAARARHPAVGGLVHRNRRELVGQGGGVDRKSTRLNSSHANISYAVFCLKKKKYSKIHLYTAIVISHVIV